MIFPDDFDTWPQELSFPIDSECAKGKEIAFFEQKFPPWEFVGQTFYGYFCEIYQARPRGRDIPASYAAKVLKTQWLNTEIGREIMSREIEVGQNISHPHLVPVLDADLKSEIPYLIQPWLSGKTLKDYLLMGKRSKISETLWIARQIAEALVALEEAGYCHANIKPGNIHLADEGHATLIDLGMSQRLDEPEDRLNRLIAGISPYKAPEIATQKSVPTVRSDIYSLGLVIKEMISQSVSHDTPQVVLHLILDMTATDPADRFPSAAALLKDLLNAEIRVCHNL